MKASVTNSLETLYPGLSSQICTLSEPVVDENELNGVPPEKIKTGYNPKSVRPDNLMTTSNVNVWFKCDVGPDHRWLMSLRSSLEEVNSKDGLLMCPCCEGKKVSATNSLEGRRPDLAGMWCYEKNEEKGLRGGPGGVMAESEGRIWVEKEGRVWEVDVREAVQAEGLPLPPPLPKKEVEVVLVEEKEEVGGEEKEEGVPVPAALHEEPPVQEKPVLEEEQKWKKKFTKVVGALKFASGFKAIMGLGFGKKKKKKKAEVVEIVEEVEVEVTADAKQRRENKASILT